MRSGSGPDQSSPFLGPSTFLTTSLLFANPSTITAANVLSRGLLGDVGGEPVVISPLYKQRIPRARRRTAGYGYTGSIRRRSGLTGPCRGWRYGS
ncbi:hypothetical protein FK521_28485, partial [Klebsiella pneumoniae]|nr:hypothetical protein [Klebsiella pneumoniae]